MIFTRPIQHAPIAFNKVFLDEVQACYPNAPPRTLAFLGAIASNSPYLRGLMLTHAEWLTSVMDTAPEDIFKILLQQTRAPLPDEDLETLMNHLRLQKARFALSLALCDISAILPLEDITKHLTDFADSALNRALHFEITRAQTRGELPKNETPFNGLTVLAMGKMGAFELNYSSDIDLIFIFDDTNLKTDNRLTHAQALRKITTATLRILSEATPAGYVFRTDIRLRPNPSTTPVCIPISQAKTYYQKDARSWERAAFIKARPCAGDIAVGRAFLADLQGFVWRRDVDFDTRQDIDEVLQAAYSHKRQSRGALRGERLAGYDIKVGFGGIRQIELVVQSHQLIYGGRDASLRDSRTLVALDALADKGLIERDYQARLATSYRHHRTLEHRIQMLRDAQTHALPSNEEAFLQLSFLCGYEDVSQFREAILHHLNNVDETPAKLSVLDGEASATGTALVMGARVQRETDTLSAENLARIEDWLSYPALQSERALNSFNQFRAVIEQEALRFGYPTETLAGFETFLRHLNSSVRIFALFANRPDILKKVIFLCALSDDLAAHLGQHQGILDGLVETATSTATTPADYRDMIDDLIAEDDDFETAAIKMRLWQREEHFRLILKALGDIGALEQNRHAFSYLAEACIETAMTQCKREITRRYGTAEGTDIAVLVMGRLATLDMNAASDLDMITVYSTGGKAAGELISQGAGHGSAPLHRPSARALDANAYYAKLTRLLITFLSAPMEHGQLYEVDMRLRPSGRAGPVASSLAAFKDYHQSKAWVWEHLALCRMRTLGGGRALARDIELVRAEIIANPKNDAEIKEQVRDMLARLREQKQPASAKLSVKKCAGGLLEIDLLGQALVLLGKDGLQISTPEQLRAGAELGLISRRQAEKLCQTYLFLERIQRVKHLLLAREFNIKNITPLARDCLLQATGFESITVLQQTMRRRCAAAQKIVDTVFL